MSGGAFILLKGSRIGPNTAKQAEIHLVNLLKILSIPVSAGQTPPPGPNGTGDGCICWDFCGTCLIVRNRPGCYLDHSFCSEIGAVSCKGAQGKVDINICFQIYTTSYLRKPDYGLFRQLQIWRNNIEYFCFGGLGRTSTFGCSAICAGAISRSSLNTL